MSTEEHDIKTPNDGSDAGGKPALSFWWLLLVFLAAFVPFGLLARVLHLAFDLPEDSNIAMPSGIITACAVIYAEPRTFKQLGHVAAIAVGLGILAMLCFLPLVLFAKVFTIFSQGLMLRMLGGGLIGLAGAWVVHLAYRRLGVPMRK